MMSGFPKHMLLDGGLGTEISEMPNLGYIGNDPLWSSRLLVSNTSVVSQAHENFLAAGCTVIETNTYQASVDGFCKYLDVDEKDAIDLIKKGAEIAIASRDKFVTNRSSGIQPLVAGSVGPYGAALHDASEYTGNYVDSMSEEDLLVWHKPRVAALIEGGVDFLAFDTIPAMKEAKAIVKLLKDFPTVKAWISFSCKDAQHICHGETFREAAELVCVSQQVFGIGINCTAPENILPLLETLPDHIKAQKTIIVYPNSGEKWSPEHQWYGSEDAKPLYSYVSEWMAAGVRWIGGCCRVGPKQLIEIKQAMDKFISESSNRA